MRYLKADFRFENIAGSKMKTDETIRFETKEESNERRIREALERTGHERLLFFFQLCEELQYFAKDKPHPNRLKNNFIVE